MVGTQRPAGAAVTIGSRAMQVGAVALEELMLRQ
jgi:hypothetical protein